jgi:hypothetical protein
MAHYLFNFSDGDREQAAALLRAKMWGSVVTRDIATRLPPAISP